MGPSKQRELFSWIWQEYLRSGDIGYLELEIHEDPLMLRPIETRGSLLELAIQACDLKAVQLFLDHGADANSVPKGGYTYLHTAIECQNNATPIIHLLLKSGANPSAIGIGGRTALHHAAMFGVADAIPALIKHGAEINARTTVDNQTTPIMEAAMFGQVDAVRCLLDLGADTTIQDKPDMGGLGGGRTARDFANAYNHPEVLQLLKAVD